MTSKTWLFLTDLNGILRGKLIPYIKSKNELKTEFSGPFLNDIFDKQICYEKETEETVNMVVLPFSEKIVSCLDKTHEYFMCNAFLNCTTLLESSVLCSRTLLTNAVQDAFEKGFVIKCGMELEWSMIKPKTKNKHNKKHTEKIIPAVSHMSSYCVLYNQDKNVQNFINDLVEKTSHLKVNIETFHAESGKSMFEVALSPSDPLTVCDNVQIYRMEIKKMAKINNMMATFCPKLYKDTAGCGAHVHISIDSITQETDFIKKQEIFDSFLAGLLHHLDSCLVLMLPFVSSYTRLNGKFWTCKDVSYGIDSRLQAIRIVNYQKKDQRIEIRVPGGDANPYLCLLYAVKAGMWGIENKIRLVHKPDEKIRLLPNSLEKATKLFKSPDSSARFLFSDEFITHYASQRMHEVSAKRKKNWEQVIF